MHASHDEKAPPILGDRPEIGILNVVYTQGAFEVLPCGGLVARADRRDRKVVLQESVVRSCA